MKIIFDLDDTVQRDKNLRKLREEAILRALGDKTSEYRKLRKDNSTINSLEKLGISRMEFYDILKSVPINLKKDEKLISFFQELKIKYKIVILSNSPKECVAEIIDKLGLTSLIDEVYGGDDFTEPKPSEESFSLVEVGDICVGNNFKKDLEIPKRKGAITTHLIKNEKEEKESEAHFKIKDLYELKDVLNKLDN